MAITADERLVFIGYSKGATDVLEAMVRYPELSSRTALWSLWQASSAVLRLPTTYRKF